MSLLAMLLFSLLALFAAPPATVTYRILGTVHSARDGSAIPHVHLRLAPANDGGDATSDNASSAEAFADDTGHFALAVPSPGRWVITASARGYHSQGYMQHEQFQSALVLSAAVPKLDLDLRLEPDAAIAGTVLDDAGEPVREAQVTLFPAPPPESELNVAPRGPLQVRTTDDLGHYELSGLEPGVYRVSVSARPWYAAAARPQRGGQAQSQSQSSTALDVVYPTTWWPGATDAEAADVLTLQPGDTREADFNLLALPATHLRVNLSAPPRNAEGADRRQRSGLPLAGAHLRLGPVLRSALGRLQRGRPAGAWRAYAGALPCSLSGQPERVGTTVSARGRQCFARGRSQRRASGGSCRVSFPGSPARAAGPGESDRCGHGRAFRLHASATRCAGAAGRRASPFHGPSWRRPDTRPSYRPLSCVGLGLGGALSDRHRRDRRIGARQSHRPPRERGDACAER